MLKQNIFFAKNKMKWNDDDDDDDDDDRSENGKKWPAQKIWNFNFFGCHSN